MSKKKFKEILVALFQGYNERISELEAKVKELETKINTGLVLFNTPFTSHNQLPYQPTIPLPSDPPVQIPDTKIWCQNDVNDL